MTTNKTELTAYEEYQQLKKLQEKRRINWQKRAAASRAEKKAAARFACEAIKRRKGKSNDAEPYKRTARAS